MDTPRIDVVGDVLDIVLSFLTVLDCVLLKATSAGFRSAAVRSLRGFVIQLLFGQAAERQRVTGDVVEVARPRAVVWGGVVDLATLRVHVFPLPLQEADRPSAIIDFVLQRHVEGGSAEWVAVDLKERQRVAAALDRRSSRRSDGQTGPTADADDDEDDADDEVERLNIRARLQRHVVLTATSGSCAVSRCQSSPFRQSGRELVLHASRFAPSPSTLDLAEDVVRTGVFETMASVAFAEFLGRRQGRLRPPDVPDVDNHEVEPSPSVRGDQAGCVVLPVATALSMSRRETYFFDPWYVAFDQLSTLVSLPECPRMSDDAADVRSVLLLSGGTEPTTEPKPSSVALPALLPVCFTPHCGWLMADRDLLLAELREEPASHALASEFDMELSSNCAHGGHGRSLPREQRQPAAEAPLLAAFVDDMRSACPGLAEWLERPSVQPVSFTGGTRFVAANRNTPHGVIQTVSGHDDYYFCLPPQGAEQVGLDHSPPPPVGVWSYLHQGRRTWFWRSPGDDRDGPTNLEACLAEKPSPSLYRTDQPAGTAIVFPPGSRCWSGCASVDTFVRATQGYFRLVAPRGNAEAS